MEHYGFRIRLLDVLPPCVDNKEIAESELSPYMKNLKDVHQIGISGDRLICDLVPKKNYFLTAFALKCYLRAGIKLTKIHSAMSFHQEPILKAHIEHLSSLRNEFQSQGLVSSAQACKKLANRWVSILTGF